MFNTPLARVFLEKMGIFPLSSIANASSTAEVSLPNLQDLGACGHAVHHGALDQLRLGHRGRG